jgi:hypothetical protein
MPHYYFVWTPENIDHLAEHDVSTDEFEEVVGDPDYEDISRSSGNPIAFGSTSAGRTLCCVFRRLRDDMIEPITAYDVDD